MAVNAKMKAELEKMWDGAKEAGASALPDGTYQFKVVGAQFHITNNAKPQFKTKVEVIGGGDEFIGETIEIRDNLESAENMGWFKSKLSRLNISGAGFSDIEDGTLAEQMVGKVFEGQAKTKGGFLNVYVNRLISDREEGAPTKAKKTAPAAEETAAETAGDPAGTEDKSFELPTAEGVDELSMKEVREALAAVGIDATEVKTPRAVLHAFCTLAEDPKATIEMTELSPLADALGVKVKKGAQLKEAVSALSKAVQDKLN